MVPPTPDPRGPRTSVLLSKLPPQKAELVAIVQFVTTTIEPSPARIVPPSHRAEFEVIVQSAVVAVDSPIA